MGSSVTIQALDVRTLLAALSFTLVISTIALTALWRSTPSLKGLGFFAAAFILQAIGSLLLILRGDIPYQLSLFAGNLLIQFGYALIWAGFNIFWERPLKGVVGLTVVTSAAMIIGQYIYGVASDQLNVRVVLVTSLNIPLLVGICATLWSVQRSKAKVQGSAIVPGFMGVRLIALAYAANIAFNLYRIASWDIAGPADQLFAPSLISYLGYAGGLVLVVMVPLGIILMTSECLEARVKAAVIMDVLTGAYNRDAFEEAARHSIALTRRQGEVMSLMVIDLDDFKAVNDEHGHATGDAVLSVVGHRILGQKRDSDILGRIGGDEFVLLLPGTPALGAMHVAERILDLIRNRAIYDAGQSVSITASIGIVTSDQDGQGYSDLFKRADTALYAAKNSGRNRAVAE